MAIAAVSINIDTVRKVYVLVKPPWTRIPRSDWIQFRSVYLSSCTHDPLAIKVQKRSLLSLNNFVYVNFQVIDVLQKRHDKPNVGPSWLIKVSR